MKIQYPAPDSLAENLQKLLADPSRQMFHFHEILNSLSDKGYPLLILIFSLPFCLPVTIPGMSTPLGLVIAWSGLRLALAKKPWWPQRLLDRTLSRSSLEKWVEMIKKIERAFKAVVRSRWLFLTQNPVMHCFHALNICFLGLLLAAPLPIPMTNLIAGLPIALLSLGLLEEDGLMAILGMVFSVVGYAGFALLFWFGEAVFRKFFGLFST